ncbi:MAG TPA: AbgT family transporter [Myxococcaceae bacterium]|nr:AbgT family transporter [Myxococcaceae bacterium]
MTDATPRRPSWTDRFLSTIERVGNALPHPATLFFLFAVAVVFASALASWAGLEVAHPGTGEPVRPANLLSIEGLHRILTQMVTNFTSFAPLGTVLVALLGIGVAEGTGFIGAAIRLLVTSAPRRLLTFVVVFAGILSNAASEVGYVLLIPLAAVIFRSVGRNGIAGVAAAFAGVSGGYSANLLLGTIDPLLAGLTEEAARIIDPTYAVNPAANYYFMFASTFVIALAGTWITERIVEPRLGPPKDAEGSEDAPAAVELRGLEPSEKRGLWFAAGTFVVIATLLLLGTVPTDGFLRDPATGSLLRSPFMSGIVALIFLVGALLGIAYGIGARTVKSDADLVKGMASSMESLGAYMVLVFFAAQFVAYFNWSNLGLIFAVEGAQMLRQSGLGMVPLMILFVLLSSVINLVMGSASAKWAIMAPVFVPMFMLLGVSPELTQGAYRVGDSVTNVISPMMSYFALIVAIMQRYDRKSGLGTLIATMLPYSVGFLLIWLSLLVVWILFGIPLGPDAPMFLPVPEAT